MVTGRLLTGVSHDKVLPIPGTDLELLIDCEGAAEANHCTWTTTDGKYRGVYSTTIGGVTQPGHYLVLRRCVSGHGRLYWDYAIPADPSAKKGKRKASDMPVWAHPTITSALAALGLCIEEDRVDALAHAEIAKLRAKIVEIERAKADRKLKFAQATHKEEIAKAEKKAAAEAPRGILRAAPKHSDAGAKKKKKKSPRKGSKKAPKANAKRITNSSRLAKRSPKGRHRAT